MYTAACKSRTNYIYYHDQEKKEKKSNLQNNKLQIKNRIIVIKKL